MHIECVVWIDIPSKVLDLIAPRRVWAPQGFESCNSVVERDDAGSALGKVPSKRSHLKSLVYPARTRRRRLWCGASGKRDGRQGGQGGKGGKERECIVFASIQRAHGAAGGCWGALEGVSAGCRVGRCCRVKDVNARDTSRALGSAFAMHSTPSVKAS